MNLSGFTVRAANKNSLTVGAWHKFGSAYFQERISTRNHSLHSVEYHNHTYMKITKTVKKGVVAKFSPNCGFYFDITCTDNGEFVCDGMETFKKAGRLANGQPAGELWVHFSGVKDDCEVEYEINFDYDYLSGEEWFTNLRFGDRYNISLGNGF